MTSGFLSWPKDCTEDCFVQDGMITKAAAFQWKPRIWTYEDRDAF